MPAPDDAPSPPRLPSDFTFGVATAGFQIEGGYNAGSQPANNWAQWERDGKAEPSGIALDFWNDYEHHLDRAVAAGCDAFRLSVEWARCVPAREEIDDEAFGRYRAILGACRDRGLEPLVTLHHFTHPAWLGDDFWLDLRAPEWFASWVDTAVGRLHDVCSRWVTTNEPNIYALQTYFTGVFPPGRRFDTGATIRALDHLLAGHALAYDVIKRHQPDGVVATNTYSFSTYELDRLLTDVLLARRKGVDREDLPQWLRTRRTAWCAGVARHRSPTPFGRFVDRRIGSTIPLDQAFPRTVAAVYESAHDATLDVVQLDYYAPQTDTHFRLPGHRTSGGRNWLPGRLLWDDAPDPDGLAHYCGLNAEPGLPVWVVENGLCNRVRTVAGSAASFERRDGWNRPLYLRAHVDAIAGAVEREVPVAAYFHWTLADNYEWGSYEPRFGLYGVDRTGAVPRWLDTDAMGHDAAGAYRRLIARARSAGAEAGSG